MTPIKRVLSANTWLREPSVSIVEEPEMVLLDREERESSVLPLPNQSFSIRLRFEEEET
jgi:hypothetical protein